MNAKFEHIESVYWVFTQLCNDQCDHCYNLSGPFGSRITTEECLQIIDNLPEYMDRLILSGGEPLAEREKLYAILDRLREKYEDRVQIMLQTNGDLLTPQRLDTLIDKGVVRFDIASIDRYHKNAGSRLMELAELFESRAVDGDDKDPLVESDNYVSKKKLSWGYWGATEDMWLGGNWARGRALEKNIWKRDPTHNFCKILSGARNFLGGYNDIPQEISIQLWRINPCCPGTLNPLGDARKERVADVLSKASQDPAMQALNEGEPLKMATHYGMSVEDAKDLLEEKKNICLFCDEIYRRHVGDTDNPLIPLPIVQ